MEHIYSCNKLNKETVTLPYKKKQLSGNIKEQIDIFRRFQTNLEMRNYLIRKQDQSENIVENSPHVILSCDPLISDRVLVMDNKK